MESGLELLLSADRTARLLDVARSTLYQWDQEGRIPRPVKIGGRIYWRGDELRAWVTAGCPVRARWSFAVESA